MSDTTWQERRIERARQALPYFKKWLAQLEQGSLPILQVSPWRQFPPIMFVKVDQLFLILGLQLPTNKLMQWIENIPESELVIFSLFITRAHPYAGFESLKVNINNQAGEQGGNYFVQVTHLVAAGVFLKMIGPA